MFYLVKAPLASETIIAALLFVCRVLINWIKVARNCRTQKWFWDALKCFWVPNLFSYILDLNIDIHLFI